MTSASRFFISTVLALLVFSGSHRPGKGNVAEAVSKDIGTTMALD
jgi:hypothetical protein